MSDHRHELTLRSASWLKRPAVQDVFRALERAGHETRIVGGAVRDALMGETVSDIDMATTLLPEEVMRLANGAGLQAKPTGIEHGTVTLLSHDEHIEVTTLRADVETYGRRAKVRFGRDWALDAARRDFTVNALYCSATGEIFDPLGGAEDVAQRRIRFIGDPAARIEEDYLRILRFFRLHGAMGRDPIDDAGLAACVRARRGLEGLSRERVWAEFSKILTLDRAVPTVEHMFASGLLVETLKSVPRLGNFTRLAGHEALLGLQPDAIRRLGALAVFSPDDAERLGHGFRLSRRQVKRLARMGETTPKLSDLLDERKARAALYWSGGQIFEDKCLMVFSAAGKEGDIESLKSLFKLARNWTPPEFPIRGEDVLALGIAAGPPVGEQLIALESWWAAKDFQPTREALLARLASGLNDNPR